MRKNRVKSSATHYPLNPFGTKLANLCETVRVPTFVTICTTFLEQKGLKTEGIFRISGNASRIQKLKLAFERGERNKFSSKEDPHVVACLLKLFFRQLPDPLLTFDLYDCWIAAQEFPDEFRFNAIQKLVDMLPQPNLTVLIHLCEFMKTVASHSEFNKMTADNLSICMAPNILRPREESVEVIIGDAQLARGLVKILFSESEKFFEAHKTRLAEETLKNNEPPVEERRFSIEQSQFKSEMEKKYGQLRLSSDEKFKSEKDRLTVLGIFDDHFNELTKQFAKIQTGVEDEDIKDEWNAMEYESALRKARTLRFKDHHKIQPDPVQINTKYDHDEEMMDVWQKFIAAMEHEVWLNRVAKRKSDNKIASIVSSSPELSEAMNEFGRIEEYLDRIREIVAAKFFYGFLSNIEARRFLQDESIGTFLVRCSLSKPFSFVLEYVSDSTSTTALLIRSYKDGFVLISQMKFFPNLSQILSAPYFQGVLIRPFLSTIPKLPWFYGEINGEEAQELLNGKDKGTFLLRFSSQPQSFTISYVNHTNEITKAVVVKNKNGTFSLRGEQRFFKSIEDLVTAHSHLFIHYLPHPTV